MNYKIVALLLTLVPAAHATCREGYIPTDVPGVCMAQPVTVTNPAWVSDEKPPSDKMPSWQREGITVINAPSTTAQDEELVKEKEEADKAGKKAAGIKPGKKKMK